MFVIFFSRFLGLKVLDRKLGNLVMNFRQNIGRVLSVAVVSITTLTWISISQKLFTPIL